MSSDHSNQKQDIIEHSNQKQDIIERIKSDGFPLYLLQ